MHERARPKSKVWKIVCCVCEASPIIIEPLGNDRRIESPQKSCRIMGDRERTVRKIKQGKVEIDYEESSLVVNYDIETVTVAENGRVGDVLDRVPEVRRIKVKNLSADKNMAQLAADIVEKCKYIHPSRTEEIEQLLIKLRKHALANPVQPSFVETAPEKGGRDGRDGGGRADDGRGGRDSRDRERERDRERDNRMPGGGGGGGGGSGGAGMGRGPGGGGGGRGAPAEPDENAPPPKPVDEDEQLPPASMDELDDYLELLYQVRACVRCALSLALLRLTRSA